MSQQSEQPEINPSAVTISTLGFVAALITSFMNINLVKNYTRKKNDMTLFYYRFTVDVILGVLLGSYLLFVVLYSYFSKHLSEYQNFMFYLSLSASNVGSCRSIIVLSVAIERMIAAYAPIFFHNYRHRCPNIIFLLLAMLFGLTEDVVLYGPCDFHLNIPKNCAAFGCAINACFYSYWTTHKSTVFALTFIFSSLLCIKLFIINNMMKTEGFKLTRVNRLALIESSIVFIFHFLPNIIARQFSTTQFFSFQNIGPYGGVTKLFGCAIEAVLVFWTMRKKKESKVVDCNRSDSRKMNWTITKI
ncbi:hypothetical protein L3Y34_006627 [Caenorhabditis briggsae]|uniref:Serpentine Receptor, class BC (Class B-like) n=1 Tax=Caenorhabditis briggsae TaxID=6238 RepID=A0AAE9A1V2_CAEBR|nr:hypothetical protein L3Y34_006627 [Caenorhabditis briggsae]